MINMVKLPTNKSSLFLRVAKGHFATSHSHINYYIDVTTQKARLSEAKAVAKELVAAYQHSTIVDTVLCLDGTQVIGTCLANELTKDGFANMNAHQTIYVITPEYTSGSQIILRDNLAPMVKGKHVLILSASITTGYTVQAAIEAVNYYGGTVAGLSAIFATTHECLGIPVTSIFDPSSLPDYASFDSRDCPNVQGRPAHRRAGEQLRLFGPLNLKLSSLFLPPCSCMAGSSIYIAVNQLIFFLTFSLPLHILKMKKRLEACIMADISSALRSTIPISLFNRGMAGKVFEDVRRQGAKVVMKNNSPECVLLSPEEYLRLIDEVNDAKLAALAAQRMQGFDPADAIPAEEVYRQNGITKAALDSMDEVEFE